MPCWELFRTALLFSLALYGWQAWWCLSSAQDCRSRKGLHTYPALRPPSTDCISRLRCMQLFLRSPIWIRGRLHTELLRHTPLFPGCSSRRFPVGTRYSFHVLWRLLRAGPVCRLPLPEREPGWSNDVNLRLPRKCRKRVSRTLNPLLVAGTASWRVFSRNTLFAVLMCSCRTTTRWRIAYIVFSCLFVYLR